MEIEFNPSRRSKITAQSEPLTRRNITATAAEAPPAQATVDLQSQLNQISLVRQDKVQQIQDQVLAQTYPPDVMVDRIANLLAVHLSN